MSSLLGAIAPRDRSSAARTLVDAAVFSLAATAGWELAAFIGKRSHTDPASSLQAVAMASIVVALAAGCFRNPQRVPLSVSPMIAFIAPGMTVAVALNSNDGSAAGQLGLVYPVIYAAAHLRRMFAWCVAACATGAAALITSTTLPEPAALADLVVIAPALAMTTLVLVTLAGHHERLMLRLADTAAADPLTGLSTRRELEAVAGRMLQPASERRHRRDTDHRTAPGLLPVDVDHFQALNDEFGHPAGDSVLVHVAQLTRASVRESDTVARMGGDELAVLVAGSVRKIEQRARAIREAVPQSSLPLVNGAPVRVSSGVAAADVGTTTFESLDADADRALDRAKAAGCNTVVALAPPTASRPSPR